MMPYYLVALLFFGYIYLHHGPQVSAQNVTLLPYSVRVPENNSATLTCLYNLQGVSTVQWRMASSEMNTIAKYYIEKSDCEDDTSPKVNTTIYTHGCITNGFTWTIKRVASRNEDEQWKCIIYGESETIISNGVQINIQLTSCPSNTALFTKTGESATLQFQATTVNPENTQLGISNSISTPNGSQILSVVYLNGKPINVGTCYGCTITGNTATGDLSIRLDNLQTSDAGTYKETIETKYIANKDPEVGESVTLTCRSSSTTTPSDHGRTLNYDWRINNMDNPSDSRYLYSTSKHTHTISNVNKEDANKDITCTAVEGDNIEYLSTRSDTFSPNVLYGPENITLDPPNTVYEHEENTTFGQVTCSATCNPACSFQWTKASPSLETISNTEVLDLGNISLADFGVYRCTAARSVSIIKTKDLTINRIYPASITSFYVEGNVFQSNITVDEHDTEKRFSCHVDSRPTSTVRILVHGKVMKEEVTDSISFILRNLACWDAGIYTCEGSNGIGQKASSDISLHVYCSPRPYKQIQRNITTTVYVPLTLSFTVVASPEPGPKGFSWHKKDGIGWLPLLSNADLRIASSWLQSNLTLLNVSLEDFGTYRVIVTNTIGTYEQHFFVSKTVGQQNTRNECNTCGWDKQAIIVVAVLGVICCLLSTYAAYLTILQRRNAHTTDTSAISGSGKHTAYINLTHGPPSSRQPMDSVNTTSIDATQQYTELSHYENTDGSVYDDLQQC